MRITVRLVLLISMLFASMHVLADCKSESAPDCDYEEDCEETTRSYNYIGIKGGKNHILSPAVTNGPETALGIVIGLRHNDFFSTELEYLSLGRYPSANGDIVVSVASISALHTYQISDNFAIYGKLGAARSRSATSVSGRGILWDLTIAAGMEYSLNTDISIRFSYDRYRLNFHPKVGDSLRGLSILYKY